MSRHVFRCQGRKLMGLEEAHHQLEPEKTKSFKEKKKNISHI